MAESTAAIDTRAKLRRASWNVVLKFCLEILIRAPLIIVEESSFPESLAELPGISLDAHRKRTVEENRAKSA
jgi:hypothetical protein